MCLDIGGNDVTDADAFKDDPPVAFNIVLDSPNRQNGSKSMIAAAGRTHGWQRNTRHAGVGCCSGQKSGCNDHIPFYQPLSDESFQRFADAQPGSVLQTIFSQPHVILDTLLQKCEIIIIQIVQKSNQFGQVEFFQPCFDAKEFWFPPSIFFSGQ